MNKRLLDIFFMGLAIAGILITPHFGCSQHANHEVDAFFFNSIPTRYIIAKPELRMPRISSHLPFTKRYCKQCHLPANFSGQKSAGQEKSIFSNQAQLSPNPKRLVIPVNQLCLKCHGYDTSKMWIHAPSAQGACIYCHRPHDSENPHLLRSQSSTLCTGRCHLEGYMIKIKVHQGLRECIECHNPHMGINALMLRKDYKEIWLRPKMAWIEAEINDRQ